METNDARAATLAAIRKALQRDDAPDPDFVREMDARLDDPSQHETHLRPRCDDEPVQRFADKLRAVDGTVDIAENRAAVPVCIENYLEQQRLTPQLVMAPHPELDEYAWPGHWQISRDAATAATTDNGISITPAFAGIAETGTVALISTPQTPAALNYLPATHIVILAADRIRPYLEDIWTLLRTLPAIPRALCFITGPSRTADIEQTIQVGAHGPTRFHVVIHGDPDNG